MAHTVLLRKNIFRFPVFLQNSGCVRLCCESYYSGGNSGASGGNSSGYAHSQGQHKRRSKYAQCYSALELPEDSERDTVRRKYIELVKTYHPDTTKDPTDRFSEIDKAYRTLLVKFKEDNDRAEAESGKYGLFHKGEEYETDENDEDPEYPDIQHTAPQHRQYLEYGGFGYGTPGQRQKQYQKYKVFRANEAVYDHRIGKLTAEYEDRLVTKERKTIKKQTTRNQIDRLVEDLIQESMSSGEFDNLSGFGKPLPNRVDYNPYEDFTTHKMNQIMVEGGFQPEWIMLRKTIGDDFVSIRSHLMKARRKLGEPPFSQMKMHEWETAIEKLADGDVKDVNKKISNFNLIVPMLNSQMCHFNLESESAKILKLDFKSLQDESSEKDETSENASMSQQKPETGFWRDLMDSLFKPR